MRVLRIADVPGGPGGGVSGFMVHSSAALEERGHTVRLLWRDDLGRRIPGRLRRLSSPLMAVAKVLALRRSGERFDVVEIHEPLAAAYVASSRWLPWLGLPPCAVLSYGLEVRGWHALLDRRRRSGRPVTRKSRVLVPLTLLSQARYALRRADVVIVPSDTDQDELVRRGWAGLDRITRANTGVRPRFFELDHERGAGSNTRFVFVGSWIDRKGTPELVAAWRQLCAGRDDVELALAGIVLPAEEVVPEFAGARVQPEIWSQVSEDALAAILRDSDVFCLPSWFEGMPLSMLEAAAAGLPCVVSAVCGNLDVFRPGDPEADGGILIPPHDSAALLAAMTQLADDARLRAALGARARLRAGSFTWAHTAEQLESAYDRATAQRAQRQAAGRKRRKNLP